MSAHCGLVMRSDSTLRPPPFLLPSATSQGHGLATWRTGHLADRPHPKVLARSPRPKSSPSPTDPHPRSKKVQQAEALAPRAFAPRARAACSKRGRLEAAAFEPAGTHQQPRYCTLNHPHEERCKAQSRFWHARLQLSTEQQTHAENQTEAESDTLHRPRTGSGRAAEQDAHKAGQHAAVCQGARAGGERARRSGEARGGESGKTTHYRCFL